MPTKTLPHEILVAALQGLEAQRARIESQLRDVRRLLRDGAKSIVQAVGAAFTSTDGDVPPRRKMSAGTKRRMAEAQKKRWAAFHNQSGATNGKTAGRATAVKGAATEAPGRKRKMSAAGRNRIIAATKRRWAAFHKAQRLAAKSAARMK
jgi:hypothetical protein